MIAKVILTTFLLTLALCQQYPPIDASGRLHFDCNDLMLDDPKFAEVMNKFKATYTNTSQLKYLHIHLDNNRISTLNSLSVLSAYTNVIEFTLSLQNNQNLQSVAGATQVSGNQLQGFFVDFKNDFKINDLSAFSAGLKNLKSIRDLNLNFYGTALNQAQHDALLQQMGKYLYFNLERLELNMQGIAISSVANWKYLSQFDSLSSIRLDYQFIDNLKDVQEIMRMAETYKSLENFTFYQTCSNYNWFTQLKSLTTLKTLELSFFNISLADHDKLVNDVGYLSNLQGLSLAFDSPALTNSQGLQKLKSLTLITRLGLTYKNSKIVDISGMSVIEKFKSLKELRLAILEPGVQGLTGIDFLSGLKITLLDIVIESQNLPKNYFATVYSLPSLKELYLKICDFQQIDSTILNGLEKLTGLVALGLNIDDTNIYDISNIDFSKFTNLVMVDMYFGDNQMKNYYNLAGFASAKNIFNIQIFGEFGNYSYVERYNNLTKLRMVSTLPYRSCSLEHSYIVLFNQDQGWDCHTCDEECLKCFGPKFSNCLTCKDTYLFMNQCLAICPKGYHPNPATHTCDPDKLEKFLKW